MSYLLVLGTSDESFHPVSIFQSSSFKNTKRMTRRLLNDEEQLHALLEGIHLEGFDASSIDVAYICQQGGKQNGITRDVYHIM